ncbi:MAG: DUF58 domain-containing protein [Fimbriimonas sp.]
MPPHISSVTPIAPPPVPGRSRQYLNPADLKRLHNFQFAAKLVVEGYFHGKHRSPYHDFSSEFADYRPYTPGDEIRAIDWRAYARTDRYYIKLFRKETDLSCTVVVDKSSSMAYKGEGDALTKLEYASYMAAALSYLLIKQGDKAGLALCDDAIRLYVPHGGTTMALQRSLVALERIQPGGPTQLATALQALFGIVRRRGLLIVISDFLDDTDALFSALGMFAHKGFSILLFQTLTPDELNLPNTPNALFKDPESSLTIAAEPDSIRKAYQDEMRAFIEDMETRAKARRIHYHLASTSEPYDKALESFLSARSRL